jgi:hypothetical protein
MRRPFEENLALYARLAVREGVALARGQELIVAADIDHAPLVRLVAAEAYRAGAKQVEVLWNDPALVVTRLTEGGEDAVAYAPSWLYDAVALAHRGNAARLGIVGTDPGLLAGVDPGRVAASGRAQSLAKKATSDLITGGHVNWCLIGAPTPGWAARVFPGLPAGQAVARLWEAVFFASGVLEPDPAAAWAAHCRDLTRRKDWLDELRLGAVHFRGPGTDLRVGLVANHAWVGVRSNRVSGNLLNPSAGRITGVTQPRRRPPARGVRFARPPREAVPPMSTEPGGLDSLCQAFDTFYQTLDAATVPLTGGGRRVGGVAHAVALSEATDVLHAQLAAAHADLARRHGRPVPAPPPGITLLESDAPDGPWTPVPPESLVVRTFGIGGAGADAMLVAALESAAAVAAFPAAKWNAMQAQRPGASHQRWHAGDVVTADALATLDSAAKLLRLAAGRARAAKSRPTDPKALVGALAQGFVQMATRARAESLVVSRIPATGAVILPGDDEFCHLAAQAGRLLPDLPEHWRYGIQERTMGEPDAAKRWAGVLFDFAVGGLVDGPNWDEADQVERVDQPALASALACEVILRSADRPNWGKGTYAAALEFARVSADEILASARASGDVAVLYHCACAALGAACDIAIMSRSPAGGSPSQFVYDQTRLAEWFGRADALARTTTPLADWPTTPGVTFSWKAGDSAMDVALEFAGAVLSATLYARSRALGAVGRKPPDLRVADPAPDPKVVGWRDMTVAELQEHTLPSLPAWPVWEIRRDVGRLGSLLRDEFRRAQERLNVDGQHLGVSVEPAYLDALAIISRVSPSAVADIAMPLSVPEVEVRRVFERVLGEPFHATDSGVEACDMITLQGTHDGRQVTVAAAFKGAGNRAIKWPLHVGGFGKNGNQIVKLFGVPADVYLVQANGPLDTTLMQHIKDTADAHAARRRRPVPYIVIDGTSTARILRAAEAE